MNKILFVTSEAHPLIKTGGLADVSGSLPKAIAGLAEDIRIILPNYLGIKVESPQHRCRLKIFDQEIQILQTTLPESKVIVWLVDYPVYYSKSSSPYLDDQGKPWLDSAERFALFCRIAVEVAMNRAHLGWKADIVHCNDWQSGLVPALLSLEQEKPKTLFTIHNLAYQGVFPVASFLSLKLPNLLWHPDGLEFFGMMSFVKAGLAYADRINTVSPTYSEEIQTFEFGCGLEGLLHHRQEALSGILNGIDTEQWNPQHDKLIEQTYTAKSLLKKQANKAALQTKLGLTVEPEIPLFGIISRLVQQKGIDLVIKILPVLMKSESQFVLIGTGQHEYEQQLLNLMKLYPKYISVTIGYDEAFAHQVEAGADIFLMPSRFEPCGLNQMYSQIYGTIPVVRATGGLADTVIDADMAHLKAGNASGITFQEATAGALAEALKRALILFHNKTYWKKMQVNGMNSDFSWKKSAKKYLSLYQAMVG